MIKKIIYVLSMEDWDDLHTVHLEPGSNVFCPPRGTKIMLPDAKKVVGQDRKLHHATGEYLHMVEENTLFVLVSETPVA